MGWIYQRDRVAEPVDRYSKRHYDFFDERFCASKGAPRMTRRAFFMGAASTFLLASLPRWAQALANVSELLHGPIQLTGTTLANRHLIVADDFTGSPTHPVSLEGPGSVVRQVVIDTGFRSWQTRWNTQTETPLLPGVHPGMQGLLVGYFGSDGGHDFTLEDVHIQGFPREGIGGPGFWEGGTIRRYSFRNVLYGILNRNFGPTSRMLLEGCRGGDLWAPAPGNWAGFEGVSESLQRPGEYIGASGIVMSTFYSSILRRCSIGGELNGALRLSKVSGSILQQLHVASLLIQGVSSASGGEDFSRDIIVDDCTIDKTLGYSDSIHGKNAVQLSWGIESARFKNCTVRAFHQDGHAFQLAGSPAVTGVDIRGCKIGRFDQTRGGSQLSHAVHRNTDCAINADFTRVNDLSGQPTDRWVLVDGGPPGEPSGDCEFPAEFPCEFGANLPLPEGSQFA